jgi:hypothetical protein
MQRQRCLEQQRRKNHIKNEIMRQSCLSFDPHQGQPNTCDDKSYRVGKLNTARDDCDKYRHH